MSEEKRPRVSVAAIVFNDNDEFFLAKRGAQARNEQGFWEFPGGSVDFGEMLRDAVKREFIEEYDMKIEVTELFGVYEQLIDGKHWVSTTFLAKHVGPDPKIMEPHKCTDIGWFTLDNLPEPLAYLTHQEIDDIRNKQG